VLIPGLPAATCVVPGGHTCVCVCVCVCVFVCACFRCAQVDPIELGIPDYYDVVNKPMDLGTIQVGMRWACERSVCVQVCVSVLVVRVRAQHAHMACFCPRRQRVCAALCFRRGCLCAVHAPPCIRMQTCTKTAHAHVYFRPGSRRGTTTGPSVRSQRTSSAQKTWNSSSPMPWYCSRVCACFCVCVRMNVCVCARAHVCGQSCDIAALCGGGVIGCAGGWVLIECVTPQRTHRRIIQRDPKYTHSPASFSTNGNKWSRVYGVCEGQRVTERKRERIAPPPSRSDRKEESKRALPPSRYDPT